MTASNSSFMNSSYSQEVIPSLKSSGLYRELGCRVENINDGKFVYPRESAFAGTAMYDLNNSNNISAGDPTLDSVTLENKTVSWSNSSFKKLTSPRISKPRKLCSRFIG